MLALEAHFTPLTDALCEAAWTSSGYGLVEAHAKFLLT